MEKRCKKCDEVKDLNLFYKHQTNRDERQSSCKVCYNQTCQAFRKRTMYDKVWYRLQKKKNPNYNVEKWQRQKELMRLKNEQAGE